MNKEEINIVKSVIAIAHFYHNEYCMMLYRYYYGIREKEKCLKEIMKEREQIKKAIDIMQKEEPVR